jgi:3',5'-cyclic AMP phosphodiesterase CpdA
MPGLTLLHLSDLHFGPPFVKAVGEALVAIAPSLSPDAVVISGDFTQRAKEEQFIAAREFIGRLPGPQIVVPGNHDVPLYRIFERLFRPFELYRKHICSELDQVIRLPGAVIVALNSTAPRRAISNGRISRWQLEWTGAVLAQASAELGPGVLKIVVSHHHFAPAPDYEQDQVLPKARRALEHFLDLDVDLIMGGHLHRAYIGNSLDVYAGHRPDKGIIIVQSGTTTSRRGRAREREKNSFNLLRLEDDVFRITHYMYFDDLGRFAAISQHVFPRPVRRVLEGEPGGR